MSRLEIRLFGGLDVHIADQPVPGFETRKTCALFAYLLVHGDRPHTREHLAGLLWAESGDNSARRSLRQALYNLRGTFQKAGFEEEPILTTHQTVRFNREVDYWFDLEAFESSLARAQAAGGTGRAHHLAGAVELYRGDLMVGFSVRDSPEFDEWLYARRESCRNSALEALQSLVDHCLVHREYRLGIRYARRLLELDPLSEPAHRTLIRLYFLSGQQSEALSQYETCRELLSEELGVEPSAETVGLYRSVLAKESVEEASTLEMDALPSRPLIPFVGRQEAVAKLHAEWQRAARGAGRLVFVEGGSGIGKTALAERAIRQFGGAQQPPILRSHFAPFANISGYEPITATLRRAILEHPLHVQSVLGQLTPDHLAELARMLPELRGLRPDLAPSTGHSGAEVRRRLFKALTRFLRTLVQSWSTAEPVIVFLDDLHEADAFSCQILNHLVRGTRGEPIWFLATRRDVLEAPHPALDALEESLGEANLLVRLPLSPLDDSEVRQVASALIQKQNRERLTRFLAANGQNRPVLLRELTDLLFEQGMLANSGPFDWDLTGPLPELPTSEEELAQWISQSRAERLPTSARRLLTLAAVVGCRFDGPLLQVAANEQPEVVQATLATLAERSMIRPSDESSPPSDKTQPKPQFSVRHASGPRPPQAAQSFEFVNRGFREAIYLAVRGERRRVMHRQIAEALVEIFPEDHQATQEAVAHHWIAARIWPHALVHLERCIELNLAALNPARAHEHCAQAVEVVDRLLATGEDHGEDLPAKRAALQEKLAFLEAELADNAAPAQS